ncbi:MAG: pyridoxamine 5'-phosphate oxidase family protein, partial [Urechidicola sp.]|nr:pyridoxamine 5'-phosphate oxidase family protein [Urechidicola sp.]
KEIYGLLDASEICNIAFNIDSFPYVQPINFGRKGNKIYVHGSLKNRMTNTLIEQGNACLSVFHLDAMKLSKSAFHHSVDFRSVVVMGNVRELKTHDEKLVGLKAIINHFVPNRWEHCRAPNKSELDATRVLEIEIETASAKIANSPVSDKKPDEKLDFWSGKIPIKTVTEYPITKKDVNKGKEIPTHVIDFYEKRKSGF